MINYLIFTFPSEAGHGNHDTKGFSMDIPISLTDGMNNVSILSVMVGLPVISLSLSIDPQTIGHN